MPLLTLFCVLSAGFAAHLTPQEQAFLAVPSNDSAAVHLKYITAVPHVAGTPGDLRNAIYVRDELRSYGFQADLDNVSVLLSYPEDAPTLSLMDASGKLAYKASLAEGVLSSDHTSDTYWRNHTFNGYAASGAADAPVVYVNYGMPEDFDALEAAGVNMSGKIALARYGECFRGLKALNAEKRGALAALIYSDPADDGFSKGKTYPEGPWRPKDGVQRGSVSFISLCAGDPSRSYLNKSTEDVCGFSASELKPSIPTIPLSWGDALPLLQAMNGPTAPANFQGGLVGSLPGGKYRLGPTAGNAKLSANNKFVTTPVWNVIAKLPGTATADEDRPVVLGNHRDAWVFGAADPNSGTASLLEAARGLGELAKQQRARRSIYVCSWSGEEYGLLGSTAWAELNQHGLLENAVAYLNVDTAVSGYELRLQTTPALASLFREVASVVPQPPRPPGVGEERETTSSAAAVETSVYEAWDKQVGTLGSGSDYTVFLDHLGIASLDFAFGGHYGVYHSVFDSYDWVATVGDPGFQHFVCSAQLWGLMALRLADAESFTTATTTPTGAGFELGFGGALPFNHSETAEVMEGYIEELRKLEPAASIVGGKQFAPGSRFVSNHVKQQLESKRQQKRQQAEVLAALTTSTHFAARPSASAGDDEDMDGAGVEQHAVASSSSSSSPTAVGVGAAKVDLSPLEAAVGVYRAAAAKITADLDTLRQKGTNGTEPSWRHCLDDRLSLAERKFLIPGDEGLPGRKWFKHTLQAPGLHTGYAAMAWPGIAQAMLDGDWALANAQVAVAAKTTKATASYLTDGGNVGHCAQ